MALSPVWFLLVSLSSVPCSFLYFLSPSSLSHVLRNYAWHRDCIRLWLWISRGRRQSAAGTWWHRMDNAIKMVLIAVLFGPSVLIHCRQGKHRSGAIGCFMFCLLTGCDFNMAMNAYRTRNRRLEGWDVRLVRRCWGENNMDEALHYFRRQQWVRNMIGNIQHKIFARPVPCPLPRDRSRSPPIPAADEQADAQAAALAVAKADAHTKATAKAPRQSPSL